MNFFTVNCLLLVVVSAAFVQPATLEFELIRRKLNEMCISNEPKDVSIDHIEELDLMDRLVHLDSEAAHLKCFWKFWRPIDELKRITENVNCGREKIHELSQFHWNHVIGKLSKKWKKNLDDTLPDALLGFFMKFASDFTVKCIDQLEQNIVELHDIQVDASLGKRIDHLTDLLVIDERYMKSYHDFLLPWQSVANKLKRSGLLSVDLATDLQDNIYSHVNIDNATDPWNLQDLCRYKLRPVYQETTLPVMNLIDMGYGFSARQRDLPEKLKVWYKMTQFCELLLGVEFHEEHQPKVHSHKPRDQIESIQSKEFQFMDYKPPDDMEALARSVKRSIKSRAALRKKSLINLFNNLRRNPRKVVANLLTKSSESMDSIDRFSDDDYQLKDRLPRAKDLELAVHQPDLSVMINKVKDTLDSINYILVASLKIFFFILRFPKSL